ncbi:MAG TPA: PilZ domain-containing protein [Terriglobales bacterium]|nr:PilZ domain-containing protein [Terriglobales bacterium]
MDPNLFAGRSGFTPDPAPSDNSVNYLRRLKQQTEADNASTTTAPASELSCSAAPKKERRRSPRYKCAGSAELTQEGSGVRMWGTLTDISLRGCYVEMSTTFPVDTKVDLILDTLGFRLRAHGVVRISYPFLGMGILLRDVDPEQRLILEKLLATLASATTVPNPLVSREKSAAEAVASAEPISLLNEIRRFFEKNGALSREEFLRIAERCLRT